MRQLQERGQPRPLRLAELLDLDPPIGPTDHRTQRDREDRDQGMLLGPLHAWVIHGGEMRRDAQILPSLHRQPHPPSRCSAGRIAPSRARGKPPF